MHSRRERVGQRCLMALLLFCSNVLASRATIDQDGGATFTSFDAVMTAIEGGSDWDTIEFVGSDQDNYTWSSYASRGIGKLYIISTATDPDRFPIITNTNSNTFNFFNNNEIYFENLIIKCSAGINLGQNRIHGFKRCIIRDGSSTYVFHAEGTTGSYTFENCLFEGNTATNIFDVHIWGAVTFKVINCTFDNNSSIWDEDPSSYTGFAITNCIFSNNSTTFRGNNLRGQTTYSLTSEEITSYGTGCVKNTNPGYMSTSRSDPDDWKITASSPAKNIGTTSGTPATDMGGSARSTPYDAGCWEATGSVDYTWDLLATPGIQTGSASWGSGSYWSLSSGDGTAPVAWPGAGNSATFAGTDGSYTITITSTRYVDSITFNNDGYTLGGSAGLDFGSKGAIHVASGVTAAVNVPIAGSGGLIKGGNGKLTLAGTNTVTGAITVSSGNFVVNGSTASGASVTAASGTTVGGTGLINGSLSVSGVLCPGVDNAGLLTIGSGLSLSSGSSFEVTSSGTAAGSDYNYVSVTGTVTIDNASLSFSLADAPLVNDSYMIIVNDGTDAISGTFRNIPQDATIGVSYNGTTYNCTVNYQGGTGNDVVIKVTGIRMPDDYDDWLYSKTVHLNTTPSGADVADDVTRFPLLVRLNPGNFSNFSQTLPGGADIRFAKTDGTHMDYGIERWLDGSGDNDTAEIWVVADTVYGNNATQTFLMYWGKSDAVDSSNSEACLDTGNGFVADYPLLQNSGDAIDITVNGLDGAPGGNVPNRKAGVIGYAQSFDGDGDLFNAGISSKFDMSANDKMTISAWVKPAGNAAVGGVEGIAGKWEWTSGSYQEYLLGESTADGFFFAVSPNGSERSFVYANDGPAVNGAWYYIAGTVDNNRQIMYLNGIARDSTTSLSGIFNSSNAPFRIGMADDDGVVFRQYFNGVIDNVILSSTARSAAWIKLCYENQKPDQTLLHIKGHYTWDRSTTEGVQSGVGTWGSDAYWSLDGKKLESWPGAGNTATFAGIDGAYPISVNGVQNVDSIAFCNNGYALTGSALNLGNKSGIYVASGVTAEIGCEISAAAGLIKHGEGTLVLSGAGAWSGPTVVASGTMRVTGSTPSASTVTVNANAKLAGTGTIGGAATVNGVLSPGAANAGLLTFESGLSLTGDATFALTADSASDVGYDRIAVKGAVDLGGAGFLFTLLFYPEISDEFIIIANDGVDPVSGTFAGLSNGASLALVFEEENYTAVIDYTGGDGNDVAITITSNESNVDIYRRWSYRQSITLNTTATGANVASNVVDFPVLVRLNPQNFPFFHQTLPGGADIRFAKTDGTHLKYVIDEWNDYDNDLDSALVWVRVDTVYGNNKTQSFIMYWGKGDAADSSNSGAVFDTSNGFVGVWHLSEDPTGSPVGSAGAIRDATHFNNHATSTGSMTGNDLVAGMIGRGHDFDGADDGASIPYAQSLDIVNALTMSAWVKVANYNNYMRILNKSMSSETDPYAMYNLTFNGTAQQIRGEIATSTASGSQISVNGSTTTLGTTQFFHAVFTYDKQYLRLYLNGVREGNTTSSTNSIGTNTQGVVIGKPGYATTSNIFSGILDEVRLERVARDSNWIRLCYQNQKTDQTLVSFEDYSTWGFSRSITINTEGITASNCIGFPLLVRLTSSNFDFNQARDSGQDIRFSKADGKRLPYQIERWDKGNTKAEIWVRVDTVFGNNAVQYVRMHWGKSNVVSQSNGYAVFDTSNGFTGTYHVSGQLSNSSMNLYNGVDNGSVDTSSGVIAGARAFNGSSQYFQVGDVPDRTSGTISCWFRPKANFNSSSTSSQGLYGKYQSNDYNATLFLTGTNFAGGGGAGKLQTKIESGGGYYVSSTTSSFLSGTWYYATWSFGNNTGAVYLNGTLENSVSNSQTLSSSGNDEFGRSLFDTDNVPAGSGYFKGTLDEMRIEKTARSADWIRLCYETQKPDADVLTSDSADAFRPLGLRRYGSLDSVYVGTCRWAMRFAANKGGGISFLAADTTGENQIGSNLFSVIYNGQSSAEVAGALSILDSSIVFCRVRQAVTLSGQPFTIDYSILGSGKLFARVSATAASDLSGGLEFRIANNNESLPYRNITYGITPSICEGVVHIDSGAGRYDLLLSPFDQWSSANAITSGAAHIGIRSNSWSAPEGRVLAWHFMVDFSHIDLGDSTAAYKYVADYRRSDTLGFYAGTPLLENSWERLQKGFWSFDEAAGSIVDDKSGGDHEATISGTPHWTDGIWFSRGDSLGGSDSITVDHHEDLDGLYTHTFMAWIKPTVELSSSSGILKKMSSEGAGYRLSGAADGKLLYTLGKDGSEANLRSSGKIGSKRWHHVTAKMFILGQEDYMKLYIDGKPDTMHLRRLDDVFAANSSPLVIGKNFNGVVDDVRFFNANLTDEEIKAVYLKGYSPYLGMYDLRADNENTIHCRMHGNPYTRILPAFQIRNWWATTHPAYVYVDGVGLTEGVDYLAALDDNRNQLTIGFNRAINQSSTIFIDDDRLDGHRKVGPTKKMYWGNSTLGSSNYFWVKNTDGRYFGAPSDNEFFLCWKMSASNGCDGELWKMRSSVSSPYVLIDTTLGDNLVPGSDASSDFGDLTVSFANYVVSSMNVGKSFTYAVEESSAVRVRLRINERVVKNVDSLCMVSRWTLYPTGQFFRYDSLYKLSGIPQTVHVNVYMDDSIYFSLYSNSDRMRGAVFYSQGYPDVAGAWLSMKNASGYQSPPFSSGKMMTHSSSSRVGFSYYQSSSPPSAWNSSWVEYVHHMDMHYASMTSFSADSIANGVQCIKFTGRRALSMITGTLDSTTAGDLNGDGFAEQEGAYILGALNNTVSFVLPAHGDTCRFFPAFRIKNYTAVQRPQYVFAFNGSDTTALLEGYQFNSHVRQSDHELVLQIDSIFCDSVGIYISSDKTLAVKMSLFEARPGNRSDTLVWRTESEQDNLGYRILRRVSPHFFDSAAAHCPFSDSAESCNADTQTVFHLIKRRAIASVDTNWRPINRKLIPGASSGVSHGPRDYRYVDRNLYNGVLYEYMLLAVDSREENEEHGPVAAMPRHVAPGSFLLGLNYPNPFRYSTAIKFSLPVESAVTLNIYTLQGRLVRRLVRPDVRLSADHHIKVWDGRNDGGTRVAAGPYIYRISASGFVKAKVMLMLR